MNLLLVAVSAVLCGVAVARIPGEPIQKAELVMIGTRTDKNDDSESVAYCPRGYQVISCSCNRYEKDGQPCDGTWVPQPDGSACIARNGASGRGVAAIARCAKTLTIERNPGAMYLDRPMVRCPPGYKVIDCNLHTGYRHKIEGPVYSSIIGNICYSTENCRYCRIQARCIIDFDNWEPGDLPAETWGQECLETPNPGTTTAGVSELIPNSRGMALSQDK